MKDLIHDESGKLSSPRFWLAAIILLGILPLSYLSVYMSFTVKNGGGSTPAAIIASLCTLAMGIAGFAQYKSRGVLMAKHMAPKPDAPK